MVIMLKTPDTSYLLIYLRVTEDMTTKLWMDHCLQQTCLQYVTAEICSILYKSVSISTGYIVNKLGCSPYSAQILGLWMNILVNVAVRISLHYQRFQHDYHNYLSNGL